MIFTRPPVDSITGPAAPEPADLAARDTIPAGGVDIVYRQPVAPVVRVPEMTVTAGDEAVSVPLVLARPSSPFVRWFRGIGARTTLLAPELQSEIDAAGGANAFPVVPPTSQPYRVAAAQPWYEQFTRTV